MRKFPGIHVTTDPKKLCLLPETYAVCRLDADASTPSWASAGGQEFTSVTRTAQELSVICQGSIVPAGVTATRGWRCLRIEGPFPADEPGVLASVVGPLAEAGISVFAVATHDTDYLLVRDVAQAAEALAAAGHSLAGSF
jgi:hypothetical protein